MTLNHFQERLLQERFRFLKLCQEEGVWEAVETISPKLALDFADGLILDLSDDQTRIRIRADRAGAAAVADVVATVLENRKETPLLAARMESANLTPFYVLASLVVDVTSEILAPATDPSPDSGPHPSTPATRRR